MKLNEVKQKIDNFFNNLTEDEIEKLYSIVQKLSQAISLNLS